MVAISRVYLRDHYLSDVLASVCLASGWWLLVTPAEAFIQAKMRQFLPEGMLKSWHIKINDCFLLTMKKRC
nr:phosphatase PAP2 family protein [Pediococcus damnosus]